MTKAFLPGLLKRPEAHVLNTSSTGGFLPVPGQTVYGASKAAVALCTEGLHSELADGFRVLVGSDSRLLDELHRLSPTRATAFIARQMKDLLARAGVDSQALWCRGRGGRLRPA